MSESDEGGSAYPVPSEVMTPRATHIGMTLRDYFAAKALQGLITNTEVGDLENIGKLTTETAYGWADAMLEAREK